MNTTPGPAPVCRALKTHPITPRTAPSGVKLPPSHDMATQASALHIGATESMQSADADHVDTTAAVASMVLPAKVTVKDIAAGSTAGAVDTHVPLKFPLETGTARGMLIPMPRSKGRHNSKKV